MAENWPVVAGEGSPAEELMNTIWPAHPSGQWLLPMPLLAPVTTAIDP
jgi:hypothetical protein